jgi:hypothetical protein
VLTSNRIRGEEVKTVIKRGDELTVFVKEVFVQGKFDVALEPEDRGVTAAKREAMLQERRRKNRQRTRRAKATKALVEAVMSGSDVVRKGEVVRVEPYGLIVDIGATKKGLVHISDLAKSDWTGKPPPASQYGNGAALVSDIKALVKVGQKLSVKLKPMIKGDSKMDMGFEVVGWIGEAPVDPSYDGPDDTTAAAYVEEDWDWAKDIEESKPASTADSDEDNEDDDEEDEEDEQDKWESKLGYDQEYY